MIIDHLPIAILVTHCKNNLKYSKYLIKIVFDKKLISLNIGYRYVVEIVKILIP